MIFLQPNYLWQGTIGDSHDLICLIALSSTAQLTKVNVSWNFTSNDDRVTVIPSNITANNSNGIIFSTVIHFAYLMEADEGNYKCSLKIEADLVETTFNFKIISKFDMLIKIIQVCVIYIAIMCIN